MVGGGKRSRAGRTTHYFESAPSLDPDLLRRCGRALFELMYRAEPRKYISRSAFMAVMRRVYGFHIAPLKGLPDRAASRTLVEAGKVSVIRANAAPKQAHVAPLKGRGVESREDGFGSGSNAPEGIPSSLHTVVINQYEKCLQRPDSGAF